MIGKNNSGNFVFVALLVISLIMFMVSASYAGGPEPSGSRPYKKTKISGVMTLKQSDDDSISIYLVGKCNKKQAVEFKYINKYLCGTADCDADSDFAIPDCPFIIGDFEAITADTLLTKFFPTDQLQGCFETDDGLGGGDETIEDLIITDVREFINVDNTITAVVSIRALN